MLLVLLLAVAATACSVDEVYDTCADDPACRLALWTPTRTQFHRLARHVPLNCSARDPATDLAARVRAHYTCPSAHYGELDAEGTFHCRCPPGARCEPPNAALFFAVLGLGLALAAGVAVYRVTTSR